MGAYVPLFTKSHYSFLEGASSPELLIERASELGLSGLGMVDRDGVYGAVRGHVEAQQRGVRLIHGSHVSVDDGSSVILLVQDRAGWTQLCRLLTAGRMRSAKGICLVTWNEIAAHAHGLLCLWGGEESAISAVAEPRMVGLLRDAFGDRLYALVERHHLAAEVEREQRTRARAKEWGLPIVAATHVLYHAVARRRLQDVLRCIAQGVRLAKAGHAIRANAEHALRGVVDFELLFQDDPAAVERTLEVAARCTFSMTELRYRYPSETYPDGSTSAQRLRALTFQGARSRYRGRIPDAVEKQLYVELALIEELEFPGYFLTMHDIITFCRAQKILCQGRGSAANSAVCFCLGITAVDPACSNLLFERFLSRERAEPPDIDLDIAHARREEVIQHVYQVYGRDRAAMVANVIRFRGRSAVREVGKVLGIAETSVDRLAKLVGHYDGLDAQVICAAGLDPDAPTVRHLLELTAELQDCPRHLSIHPGGFLLGHEPVCDLVPIENGTMAGRTVIQWDKDDCESLGLFKVDLLGLGALTLIDECFHLLREHRQIDLGLATIPQDDGPTYDLICRADTVGVFQIESRAQMSMLPRLRPRTYYDLVIEVSLVRPGPISGGMVHPYLRRRRGEEEITYPHACLKPVLERTLGIPLFQEQVMSLAMVAADYTPGEADQLRRDMAAWRKTGRIEAHRERLVSRMVNKGISVEFAERVFEQIRGFGEYGFPESHAASFALLSYATSYLRCHFPAEFTCALLNAQPLGFYTPATIIDDAKRHSVQVRPVHVSTSPWQATLEPSGEGGAAERERPFAVRLGLSVVKGLGEADAARLIATRALRGFTSVEDLAWRAQIDKRGLEALATAGALTGLEGAADRRAALWETSRVARSGPTPMAVSAPEESPRFAALSTFDSVAWDYDATAMSPRAHPLATVRSELEAQGLPDASQVARMPDGSRARYAGIVICRQRPGTAGGVVFMTLEDETGFVNIVIWKKVFESYAILLKTSSFLGVKGKIQNKEDVVHLVAESFFTPTIAHAPRTAGSRDFH